MQQIDENTVKNQNLCKKSCSKVLIDEQVKLISEGEGCQKKQKNVRAMIQLSCIERDG